MEALEPPFLQQNRFPKEWALGAIADQLPPLPYEPEDGLEKGSRPLGCWYRFNYHVRNQPYQDILQVRLAEEQNLSFQLLYEWWTAQYQDSAFSMAARSREIAHARIDLDRDPNITGATEVRDFLTQQLQLDQLSPNTLSEPLGNEHGHYHKTLLGLFEFEFGYDSCYCPLDETNEMVGGRRKERTESAIYAYCQVVGWEIYQRHQQDGTSQLHSNAEATLPGNTGAFDGNCLEKSANAFIARGPIIESCPWLKEDYDELRNMPYYLWDVQRGCTVTTADLDFQPPYVAISHTWGRWVISKPISVEGVPWKVPQNARFRVEDLAELLSQVPGGLGFVWFDLVCIPQDGSAIGAREIARQAKIFRGAKYAVAWLNTIDNLDGLFSVMRWRALQFLTFSTNESNWRLAAAIEASWIALTRNGSGLYFPHPDRQNIGEWTVNPWFTSLWTLQEVCLRPDMWICVKDWTYLSSDGTIPITMSGFVAILGTDRAVAKDENNIAYNELFNWGHTTGLQNLLDLDQVAIITLGDRRECTGRRAEAIMSVLGATEWYNDALQLSISLKKKDRAELEQDLVLGKYPVQFVNEVAHKTAGAFFTAFNKQGYPVRRDRGAQSQLQKGSMLPFSSGRSVYIASSPYRFLGYSSQPIPSTASWCVQIDGTVRIPKASIISSRALPEDVLSNELPVQIFGLGIQEVVAPLSRDLESRVGIPYRRTEWNSLHHWVRQRTGESYAVLTQYQHRINQSRIVWTSLAGVILERSGSDPLHKIANFVLYDESQMIDVSKADDVNWIVS